MWGQNVVPCCAFCGCSGWVFGSKWFFILPQFRSINSCENSKCLRNKVLKTLGYVRNFTYLGAANITSKQKSDMTKVAIKNENITSFGGIYHIMDVFSKLGFEKLTESVLGKRGSSGKAFSHGSIFGSLFFSYLCGGECLEDINALIGQFKQRPDTLLPGADTVGRGLKELAEENIIYKSEISGKSYSFNTAEKLNTLLLRMIRRMGLIKVGSHVDLDFDHQFVPAHKFDAKYSYKQDFGYFPGWASIGGIIVGGENRDGNTNVRFHQEDTLRRIMDRVTSELGVVIERFRADCGSFSKEIIQTVEQRCNTFYIRTPVRDKKVP